MSSLTISDKTFLCIVIMHCHIGYTRIYLCQRKVHAVTQPHMTNFSSIATYILHIPVPYHLSAEWYSPIYALFGPLLSISTGHLSSPHSFIFNPNDYDDQRDCDCA
jgi:hypothetical protein